MAARMPQLSVLMSVHNGARYLRESVASILEQTFSDFEFIIINDGSTDATADILASFRDNRLVLIQQERTGLTKALNTGLARARGVFIARIDADDIAQPERLRKQVAFLNEHPATVLAGSDAQGIDPDGNVIWETSLPVSSIQIKWRLLFYNCITHSSAMFRSREVRELGGYTPSVTFAQDYDLWLKIAARYPVGAVTEPLVCYRIPAHEAISCSHAEGQQRFVREVQQAVLCGLAPALGDLLPAIRELGLFLFFSAAPPSDIAGAEQLLRRLYAAFCKAAFAAGASKDELQAVMIQPYLLFAWRYYERGQQADFQRCIHEAIACGLRAPIAVPEGDLQQKEQQVFEALENYAEGALARQASGRALLASQHRSCAWQYYNAGDMTRFRQRVLCAWRLEPDRSLAALWLKSFLGKQMLDEVSSIKRQMKVFLERS